MGRSIPVMPMRNRPMDRANRALWCAEHDPAYKGQTVLCVGGGPSLKGFDFEPYRHLPKIAVNQAFELVPEAKYLLFADKIWFNWNEEAVTAWKTADKVAVTVGISPYPPGFDVKRLTRTKDAGLCMTPNEVAGIDSGCLAVNLAYHLGAARIILLGYDSGFGPRTEENGLIHDNASHFHDKHQNPANDAFYKDRYGPRLSGLCQRLRDIGVPVVRGTPPGRPDIPYMALPEALSATEWPSVEGLITEFVP